MKLKHVIINLLAAVLSAFAAVAFFHSRQSHDAPPRALTDEDMQAMAEAIEKDIGNFSFGVSVSEHANHPYALIKLQIVELLISCAEDEAPAEYEARQEWEAKTLAEICKGIDAEDSPRILYAMAIVLYEGYRDEFRETPSDRLHFMTREAIVHRLSQLGTAEAYDYFRRLHAHYGTDAGESTKYKEMEANFPLRIRLLHD